METHARIVPNEDAQKVAAAIVGLPMFAKAREQIGRASCRERV